MASTFKLSSHSYDGRYLYVSCTQTRNIGANTSTIAWELVSTGGNSNYYTVGPTTLKINGETAYYKDRVGYTQEVFPAARGSVSGTTTVNHDVNGNATIVVSLSTNIYTGVIRTSEGTWTLDSNPRFAELKTAPDFYDDENPTITYSNPAGSNVTLLQACITLDGNNADIPYRDISKTSTSYNFVLTEAEKNTLYSATSGNSRKVYFKIKSTIGGVTESSMSSAKEFAIRNPNPTINPSFEDTNTAIVALTGDKTRLVRYCSDVNVTIGAAAIKGATLKSKQAICGSTKLTADGMINDIPTNVFEFQATDSRGNVTKTTYTHSNFVNYVKPTSALSNNMPSADGSFTVKAMGNYFNGYFGAKNNALNVYYRYKKTGASWSNPIQDWTLMTVTLSGNTYTATANVTGLEYQTSYVFQTYAKDVINTTINSPSEKTIKAAPVFDWGETDFKFNVPVYDQNGLLMGPTEIVKLWTNPTPSSTFAAQTVSLSLSDYSLVIVDFGSSSIDSIPYGTAHIFGKNTRRNAMNFASYICTRPVTVKDTGVVFEGGKVFKTYGTSTSDDRYMVPLTIYGIRGIT